MFPAPGLRLPRDFPALNVKFTAYLPSVWFPADRAILPSPKLGNNQLSSYFPGKV